MREFTFSAEEIDGEGEDEQIELSINGGSTYLISQPTDGQLALFMARSGGGDFGAATSGFFEFMHQIFDEDSALDIERRLALKRGNPERLTIEAMTSVIKGVTEDWTGRPTNLPAGSTPSQPTGGQRSTGRVAGKGSTLSSSRRTAS